MTARDILSSIRSLWFTDRGRRATARFVSSDSDGSLWEANPLRSYFNSIVSGPGIWKWDHYFDVYDRHLQKFVGQPCHISEVGVYSGGSLKMWKHYFGCRAKIYGIDIQPACRQYENDHTRIFIGDQSDRSFWAGFKEHVPQLDVLIDDGGHLPEQQIVTLEEILPHLRPGGVYICEDITGTRNHLSAYLHGLSCSLSAFNLEADSLVQPTAFQQSIASIHFYPFIVVIEKHTKAPPSLRAPKRGTEWQPFRV